jgi:ASTRA-associated protein 1
MDISALNFCAFATCEEPRIEANTTEGHGEMLIASPNGLDSGGIDIFQLPSQRRLSQLSSKKSNNTGMVMALSLFHAKDDGSLSMVSGYEDGQVMVHRHQGILDPSTSRWETLMTTKAHSQPVLSLSLSPSKDYFITSSADAQIAKISMPSSSSVQATPATPLKSINTKHAGQQSISMRSDGKIFVTAGWDARVRVYSAKTMKELAVLKWHKDGSYSTAFAEIMDESELDSVPSSGNSSQDLAKRSALDVIKQERSLKAQRVHWLAAGGKDGKISLWDIY